MLALRRSHWLNTPGHASSYDFISLPNHTIQRTASSGSVLIRVITYLTNQDLGPMLGFVLTPRGACLVIYAYGDDGSDPKHKRVIAVSIVAGREEWWQDLEAQWVERCGGIPFHATDCESNPPHGDYKRTLSHKECKAMYRDLVGIVASSRLMGVGIAFDLMAKKKCFPGSAPMTYFRGFMDCMYQVTQMAEEAGEVCEVTYDIGKENEANAGQVYASLRENDQRLCRWLHPKVSFAPARESARLQVGDMLAYEAWKALDHHVGEIKRKRKSWEILRATNRFEVIGHGEEWCNNLKQLRDSGELKQYAGFDEDSYKAWLKERGRQNNTSNVIEFIRSINGKRTV